MDHNRLNRRDFHHLTMAALGGAIAGAQIGCNRDQPGADPAGPAVTGASLLLDEPHVCRGLNACKGLGKGGDNACAGQGACATAELHTCGGQNVCKGQGGCGEHPGENACKGQGHCSVPLMSAEVWQQARTAFEAAMKSAGKTVGKAPPAVDGQAG